LRKIRD